jgi:hypothetical protein
MQIETYIILFSMLSTTIMLDWKYTRSTKHLPHWKNKESIQMKLMKELNDDLGKE